MSIDDLVRRTAFFTFDFMRGSKCRTHLKDIQAKYSLDNFSDEQELNKILSYAIHNVPFYSYVSTPSLSLFPVMNKSIYKREGTNCFSKEFCDVSNLHKVQTGGSTGEPMVAYQDSEKRNRVKMDLVYAHNSIGWKLGERYVFIRNWATNYKQSKVKQIAQNFYPVPIATFDDKQKIKLVQYLKHHKNTVIFGYSSSVVDFMNFLTQNNISASQLNVKLIVCDSDELSKSNKEKLSKVFKCTVVNRYDNEENGLIAISDGDFGDFKVNYVSLHIELLSLDSDEPVAPGQIGRVVITDLYNKAMPLIRYDTGDLAVSLDKPGHIKTLSELSGRKVDGCFSVDGILISSVALSGSVEVFQNIEKYRLVQESNDTYSFYYDGFVSDEENHELDWRLHELFGKEASINIVKTQLSHEQNGKYKTIVNNWMK